LNPRFFGRHVEPVRTFDAAHGEFLLYERFPDTSWILRKYMDSGARVEMLAGSTVVRWYLIRTDRI
jgi:hypothetical protein